MCRCLSLLKTHPLLPLLLLFLLASPMQAQYIPPGGNLSLNPHLNQSGELTAPNGPYVLMGQQLILVCSLNRTLPFNASDIYIEKGDGEFNGTTTPLDQYTVLMNNTVTSLRYKGTYFCWAGPELLGSEMVHVDYYPEPVRDVQCMFHNWDGAVDLTWDLGVQYVRPKDLNVTLFFGKGNEPTAVCQNQNHTFCSIPVYFLLFISVRVDVTNMPANVTAKGELETFNLARNVKPGLCEVKWDLCRPGRYSFTLVWSHNRPVRRKLYRLRYTSLQDIDWQEVTIRPTMQEDIEDALQNFTLSRLRANSQYRVKLDTRPMDPSDGSHTGYWSDAIEGNITTLESAPVTGPLVTGGSFHQGGCVRGARNLTIYWQPPAVDDQNGVITQYKLASEQTGKAIVNASMLRHVVHADCRHNVHLRLYAATEMDWSSNYSQLNIPQAPDEDMIVEVYTVVYEGEVQVVWESRQGQITQYTVYWCQGDTLRHVCTSKIQWQHVEKEQRHVMLPVRSSETTLFGVSASKAGVSDGIHWSRCVVQNIAPTLAPSPPQIHEGSEPTTRRVTWSNLRCLSGDNALITHYRLLVTSSDKTGDTFFDGNFNLSVREYTLRGLNVNGKYSIRLMALSNAREGPFSDVVYMVIQAGSVDDTLIMAVLISLTIVGSAFVTIWCKRKQIVSCVKQREEIKLPKFSSPKSSPTHDLIPVTAPTDVSRSSPKDDSHGDSDTATVSTRQYVLCTDGGSGTGSASAFEKTSSWRTSESESGNVPSVAVDMTEEQITLTLPRDSLSSNPHGDSRPIQTAHCAARPKGFDLKDLQGPRVHTQTPQADGGLERGGCVNHSAYVSSPSQAVSQGSPASTGLSSTGLSSTGSDSASSKSNSATSYVKVTEQPSGQVQETLPSTAVLHPSAMQTFQPGKNPGNSGYVQVGDMNTSTV